MASCLCRHGLVHSVLPPACDWVKEKIHNFSCMNSHAWTALKSAITWRDIKDMSRDEPFYYLKSWHYGVEMDTYRCYSSVERFLGNTATDRLGLALLSYLHLKLTSESIGATESLALLYNMFLVAVIHLLWFACLKHIFVSLSLSFPLCVSDILMLFDFLVLDKHTWQIN